MCSVLWADNFTFLFPQANHVLQSFLESQVTIEDFILQSDKALTDGQKAMEGTWEDLALTGKGRLLLSLLTYGQKGLPTKCTLC